MQQVLFYQREVRRMSDTTGIIKILSLGNSRLFTGHFDEKYALGYDVRYVHSSNEVIDHLTESFFDVVVINHEPPHFDGCNSLTLLKKRFPSVPCILVTCNGSEDLAREAFLSGVSDYISGKSYTSELEDKLMESVNSAIERDRREKNGFTRENEEKFRLIFNHTGLGIGLADLNGKFIDANPALQEMLGYSSDELLKMSTSDVTYPEDIEYEWKVLKEAILKQDSPILDIEKRYIRKDGQTLWGRLFASPIRDRYGNPRFIMGILEDITEKKRTQSEYDRFFNLSLDPLCIAGFDGTLKKINNAWTKVLGWSREELLSKPWLSFVHPDDYESTIKAGEKLMSGESVIGFENRYICKDGTYRWLAWNSFPVPEERLMYGVVRDITGRKMLEEERDQIEKTLLKERNLLEKLMYSSPVGITIVDRKGEITFANPAPKKYWVLQKIKCWKELTTLLNGK